MNIPPASVPQKPSLASLPTELHELILSFLPFDTLFLASKALPLWQTLFTTRLQSSTQYTPPGLFNIAGTHQIFYGPDSDFMCLVQNGTIHKIYLQYSPTGYKLDITNDPILTSKFFYSIVTKESIYPCIPVTPEPTRRTRTLQKPNPYLVPKGKKKKGWYQISPTVYYLDEIEIGHSILKVAETLATGHNWELPRGLCMKMYWMEIGPGVRFKPRFNCRQGLEAFFRGEVKDVPLSMGT
ncbi:hypothetical protein TWF506_000029 [Arthrobotrys conoides]|uniref:F-box domain-containing protein n=1 Tax=Arthrobotrys conoides TaxID=74498 RepID=A0AAN8ND05_9PEZI